MTVPDEIAGGSDSEKRTGRQPVRLGGLIATQLLPTFGLMAGFIAIAAGLLYYSAGQQNMVARDAGHHLARTAISVVHDEIEAFARDYAFWDAAVERLLVSFDPAWADDNVGIWVIEELAMDGALVFGAGNRVLNVADTHDPERFSRPEALQKSVIGLIAEAREQISDEGEGPTPALGVFRDAHGVHLAAAAAIVWENGRDPALDGIEPGVLFFYRTIDESLLADMEMRFLLSGPRLVLNDPHGAMVPLRSFDGRVLAGLAWDLERPGTEMLHRLALPLAASLLVMIALVVMIVVRVVRSARQVRLYQDDLEAQTRRLRAAWSEAENANRSKSRFLAMMSHELRTPLNAVIGFADFMRQAPDKILTRERVRGYAEDIHTSGSYLLALINDILDMSKIESNRYELFEEDVALDGVIEQSVALVRGMAKERSIRLIAPPTGLCLRVDERALKQILLNLLSNAVKFSHAGGVVQVGHLATGEALDILVTDTGLGMTEQEVQKAFTPFGQTKDAHIRNMDGTGLGLNIARSLTGLHGGDLIVESAPDKGTTVTIRLPASRVISGAATRSEPAA